MRSVHALLLSSIVVALLASGCHLGPGFSGPYTYDGPAGAYDHSTGRRQTTHWEPTPTVATPGSEVGQASLQGQPYAMAPTPTPATGDPWASGSSMPATQAPASNVGGVNARTSSIQ